MSDPTPIHTPAGYASANAIGYAGSAETLVLVSEASPLPVASMPAAPPPLVGYSASPGIVGPFEAVAGRIVTVTLRGMWQGKVSLHRSTDGTTLTPLRVAGEPWGEYDQPGCEQAWLETEDGVSFFLDLQPITGVIEYRVSQ
jgi:hypothetical protein